MGILNLPEGYTEIKTIDLLRDKKLALLVNLGSLLIAVVFFAAGVFIVPFNLEINGIGSLLIIIGFAAASVLYIIGHELTHGFFFKKYSGKKAKYGFTGMYAYASSDAYYNKRQFMVIGLSPVVLFGALFLMLNIVLPGEYFWGVYFLQIINLSGAAGDLYVSVLMSRMPEDILVADEGVAMKIYSKPESSQ